MALSTLNRREVLKIGGAAAAATLLTQAGCQSPEPQPGLTPTSTGIPNTPESTATTAAATPTAAFVPTIEPTPVSASPVPLEVIALNRLAFGPRPGDLDAFRSLPGATPIEKLTAYVDQQLDPAAFDDGECEARLNVFKLVTLDQSLTQLWADHVANNPYMGSDREYEWRMQSFTDTQIATFLRAVYSRRQLFEVLVDFWHNHFNVLGWHYEAGPLFAHYDRDVIRAHALGNFREMLQAVAQSPAMLYYLNNATNSNAGPNENFARELFELHTLGAENYLGVIDPVTVSGYDQQQSIGYVDNDVYEAARCFTGWRVNDNLEGYEDNVGKDGTFLYYRPWHDRFNKIVLGKYIPHDQADMKDGLDVLDAVAAHPGTARFIARKLCRRLISDQPPERIVNEAAEVFLAHASAPDQLKRVTRAIVLSEEFRTTWGEKIKRPFEAAASMLRALDIDLTRLPDDLVWVYGTMGQPLFSHPAPNGYADTKEAWANSMSMLYRWNLGMALCEGWLGPDESKITVDWSKSAPDHAPTANEAADFWIDRILGRPFTSAASREDVVTLIAKEAAPDKPLPIEQLAERLPGAVELILMSPDFQLR